MSNEEKIVNFKINDKKIIAYENDTILEVAKREEIYIPTLCFLKEINLIGTCDMCLVEIEGKEGLVKACKTVVEEGMNIYTNTTQIEDTRKVNLDLILSNHNKECNLCVMSGNCELQDLANKYNLVDSTFSGYKIKNKIDDSTYSIVKEFDKCILCQRCISTCEKVQGIGTLKLKKDGLKSKVIPKIGNCLNESNCTFCGQCIQNCPTGALHEKDDTEELKQKLKDKDITVIVQTAPSVRVALR